MGRLLGKKHSKERVDKYQGTHGNAVLKREDFTYIMSSRETLHELGRRFGVTHARIWQIKNGRNK